MTISNHSKSSRASKASSSPCPPGPEDILWDQTNPDLLALRDIISAHFNSPCQSHEFLGIGAYARGFLCTLENGFKLVARVILPVRETIKTEAEVSAMDTARARTSIPVPKIHLYCSTPKNPVGAEWILMDLVPGRQFFECFDNLTYEQKTRTATDLVNVVSSLYAITSSYCGSMITNHSLADGQRSPRYISAGSAPQSHGIGLPDNDFIIGPYNGIAFLELPNTVPASSCGPFLTERSFLEATGYGGSPPTRSSEKWERWPYERLIEVYDKVRPLYPAPEPQTFHFTQGDLSGANIFLDPETGAITGIIDWEMSGFRPAWLAAAGPSWFDDDSCKFTVEDHQDGPDGYEDLTEDDRTLLKHFRTVLGERNLELLQHHEQSAELRAIFYNLCQESSGNVVTWLTQYEKYEWDVSTRGPFPFDLMSWIMERLKLYDVYITEMESKGLVDTEP